MRFITRAYNSFELNKKSNASIIKRSSEDRLLNEIEYYENLPNELQVYFPRLINSSKIAFNYELELEYYAYGNLGSKLINEDFNADFWRNSFDFIFKYIDIYKGLEIEATYEDSILMYVSKTEIESDKLFNNFSFFKDINNSNSIILNGKHLKSFNEVWPKIKEYIIDTFISSKYKAAETSPPTRR